MNVEVIISEVLTKISDSMMLSQIPHEIAEILTWNFQQKKLTFAERLNYISARFLGRIYLSGALGEGEQGEFDQNPLVRTECFDCVTYVNTVLAILFSKQERDFLLHLSRLNYKGAEVSFANRFHFIESEWNDENQKSGYIRDMTTTVKDEGSHPLFKVAQVYLDKPKWLKKQSELRAASQIAKLPLLAEEVSTPYLPLTAFFTQADQPNLFVLNQLPEVAVIEIVRPDWDLTQQIGTHLNVSHLGFLLKRQGVYYFRHASQRAGKVVEEQLLDYVHRYRMHDSVKGLNIQQINAER